MTLEDRLEGRLVASRRERGEAAIRGAPVDRLPWRSQGHLRFGSPEHEARNRLDSNICRDAASEGGHQIKEEKMKLRTAAVAAAASAAAGGAAPPAGGPKPRGPAEGGGLTGQGR